uniref:TonB-dependent receptor n=1 Tax=Roseihalotalea indica TaxID=2867963 RepID=A0AA49GMJ7_9BACT|nr:TonB-dependent receptor [Tunicatimonas sp. TK19036]
MRKGLLICLSLLGLSFQLMAQTGSVEGTVLDDETREPLVGANVVLEGTTTGTMTDIDGKFMLEDLSAGKQTLNVSFVGYETNSIPVTITSGETVSIGSVSLGGDAFGLDEVEIIASVAIDRKTPVAVSTIKGREIEQKIGNQEFPEILRNTPSIYVTKQGGGFGDARINVRGFDQRNVAVMINGIPVNDMENGWVYWSNWAGLSDVTSSIQVQRGLGASRLAISSVGGTINIITDAAKMQRGGSVSASVGNDGYQKYGVSVSTGLSDNGWAFSFQGTHTQGNGYVDGTEFSGWSYFASLAKQLNDQHSLNFTVIGAPQWHNQRSWANPITEYNEWGEKYNSDYGYLNGDEFSNRKNFYHKPKAFLNHYWTISDKTELATSAYVSLGRGGGTGELGQINGRSLFSSTFETESGILRFDDIQRWNQGGRVPDFDNVVRDDAGNVTGTLENKQPWTGGGGFDGQYVNTSSDGFIRRSSMNEHNWFGVLSTLTHELSETLTLSAGIDGRYYKGLHYRRVENLLGADAYFDDDDINNPEKYITDEGRADGNEIDYYNDGLVNWLGVFGQLEYSLDKLSVFGSFSLSNQGFKRIDYFNYLDSDPEQETDWQNFFGGTAKVGANYNISEQHNVFANAGYFSRQPIFDNVFINFVNDINADAKNEKILGFEAGYGFRSRVFSANLNVYRTEWADRAINRSVQGTNFEGTANIQDLGQLHQGVEIDFVASILDGLDVNGMVSVGNWTYTSDIEARVFDDEQNFLGSETLYLDDVKVGDAAQTTFSLGATYEIITGLRVYGNYFFADNLYADYNLADEGTFTEPGMQAWKLPSYDMVDLGVAYTFPIGKLDATLRVNVNNVFDNIYISESDTNIAYDAEDDSDVEYGTGGSIYNRVYYGFGRTWNAGLKIQF